MGRIRKVVRTNHRVSVWTVEAVKSSKDTHTSLNSYNNNDNNNIAATQDCSGTGSNINLMRENNSGPSRLNVISGSEGPLNLEIISQGAGACSVVDGIGTFPVSQSDYIQRLIGTQNASKIPKIVEQILPVFDGKNIPVTMFVEHCNSAVAMITPDDLHCFTMVVRTKIIGEARNYIQDRLGLTLKEIRTSLFQTRRYS